MNSITLRSVLIRTDKPPPIRSAHHTGIETAYPARKSLRRLIGAICMCAAGVSVVMIAAAWIVTAIPVGR